MKNCPICGKELPEHYPSGKRWKSVTCSRSCGAKLRSSLHGSNWSNPEVQNKAHATSKFNYLKEHGVENPAQNPDVKRKTRDTNISRYGVPCVLVMPNIDHANNTEVAKSSRRATCLSKLGVDTPLKVPAVHSAGILAAHTIDAVSKRQATCLAKYSVSNIMDSKEHQNKMQAAAKLKFVKGSEPAKQKLARSIATSLERYGVSCNWFKNGYQSTGEREVREFVQSLGFAGNQNNKVIPNMQFDIYIPEKNLVIEYNGSYWHCSDKKDRKYHWVRTKACETIGLRLIHIYEWEWLDPIKQPIIKSIIKISLGIVDTKVFARQCEVKHMSTKEYRAFCDKNHLQGYRHAEVVLGLFYKDELQQLMSFSKPQERKSKTRYQYEIVRGCPGSNNLVVGGVSKLFSHFVREYQPTSVMSYCDMNKFTGTGYQHIGMRLVNEEVGNRWFVNKRTGAVSSWLFRDKEKRADLLDNSFTIYGAGNQTYVWLPDYL